jgi:hypothetical protein
MHIGLGIGLSNYRLPQLVLQILNSNFCFISVRSVSKIVRLQCKSSSISWPLRHITFFYSGVMVKIRHNSNALMYPPLSRTSNIVFRLSVLISHRQSFKKKVCLSSASYEKYLATRLAIILSVTVSGLEVGYLASTLRTYWALYTGRFKKKVTLSYVYNEVTSEPAITRYTEIIWKTLKVCL